MRARHGWRSAKRGRFLFACVACVQATFAGAVGACTSFTGDGGGPSISPEGAVDVGPAADASTPEATEADSLPPESDAAVVNLLTNGDFEVGCSNWTPSPSTTLSASPVAHTGSGACLMCGTTPGWYADQRVPSDVPLGGQLRAALYLRRDPADASIAPSTDLAIFTFGSAGPVERGDSYGPAVTDDAWHLVQDVRDVTDNGDAAIVSVSLRLVGVEANTCLLVDDAVLFRSR